MLRLLALLLLAAPAQAADRDEAAEATAERAQQVWEEDCASASGLNTTLAARSVARVSTVWADVSEELERSRKVYLLYWRAVLAQCLDQEERAMEDLRAFLAARNDSNLWSDLVDDAKRRLARLDRAEAGGDPSAGGVVLGGVLAGSAAVTAGLSGWRWSTALGVAETLYEGPHSGSDRVTLGQEGDDAALQSYVLTGVASGIGAAAAVTWIATAVVSSRDRRASKARRPSPVLAAVPSPGGVIVVVAGRW